MARKTLLKIEVGGGVRSIDTIERLVDAGVSRVVLGTVLVRDPQLAQEAISRFPQVMAAGIDARDGEVAVEGWEVGGGIAALDLAAMMHGMGYRHLVYTDIARDGMQTGIDPGAYRTMAAAFGHPVTASGGIATIDDIERLGQVAVSIDGVITGRAVYEGTLDVAQAVRRCRELTRAALAAEAAKAPCAGCADIPGIDGLAREAGD